MTSTCYIVNIMWIGIRCLGFSFADAKKIKIDYLFTIRNFYFMYYV